MTVQLLEKALEESGNDLDAAIRSLHELRIGYSDGKSDTEEIENGTCNHIIPSSGCW